ncbi:MAG: ABC transporter permease [Actinomycetota bacterium]|nr:ABC transporter permease [Actinomycetota bacterium]
MRAVWLVARVELRRRLRNRSALFTAFVGPLLLASVFGILMSGTGSFTLKVGIVDLDGSPVTSGFVSGLLDERADAAAADSPVEFVRFDTREDAATALDGDDIDTAIVLPDGFGAAVMAGRAATITVLRDPSKEVSAGVAASVAGQYTVAVSAQRLAVATVTALGGSAPTEAQLTGMTDDVLSAVVAEAPGGNEVSAATFYGASMSILFLFFTVAFAARSLIVERKNGVVPRILAASTPASAVVIGKVLAVGLLGFAGFVTVWGVTTLAFGSHWGDPAAVVLTMVATVLAVGGVATFVCGLARTEEQADGYTSAVAFALALLGGNFIGPGQAPEALQRTASFTPNGHAIDAFTRLAADGAGVGDIRQQLLLLLAFAACFGLAGLWLGNRAVAR